MREQSKTLADKAKAGMDKFKAALKKTFSKENLQSKAEMVKVRTSFSNDAYRVVQRRTRCIE